MTFQLISLFILPILTLGIDAVSLSNLVVTLKVSNPLLCNAAAQNGISLTAGAYDCNTDCQKMHGSDCGSCNKASVCACNYVNQTNIRCTPSTPPIDIKFVGNAGFQECGSTAFPLKQFHQALCSADCQCGHGGIEGKCDFTNQICKCIYPAGYDPASLTLGNCTDTSYYTKLLSSLTLQELANELSGQLCLNNSSGYNLVQINGVTYLVYVNGISPANLPKASHKLAIDCSKAIPSPIIN